MVADLRYFNSLENEVDSIKSQLKTKKYSLNEIDRLSKEYYYADHMNAILGVYTTLDEFTDLQCDYMDQVVKFTAQILPQNVKSILKNTNVIEPGLYKVHTKPNQTRTPQLPQDIKKTNKRVSFSKTTTSVSRPQLKSNQLEDRLVEIILFIVDSGCSKHMTGNLKLLSNFVEKFLGTVKFGNDQIASILGYGDLVQGNVTIKRVYYVEGLNHNLFSVGQFYDVDLEVTLSTCYICNLKGNDLLTGSRGTYMYSITLQDTSTPNLICLMAKATSSQAEAIATACFTQNCSLVIPRHKKTPYHIINGRKPSVKFFHIFGSLCYIIRDGENLDKMKEKSSDLVLQCSTTALEHASLSPSPQSQKNVPQATETITTSNEVDLLFSLMLDELLNGTTPVVSKSSAVTTVNAPNQHQQKHTTPSTSTTVAADTPLLNIQTTPESISQAPTQAPTVTPTENIIQAEQIKNMHKLTKTNLSTSLVHWYKNEGRHHLVITRRQLETDGEMCMFALTVSRTEPKNIKEAMDDFAWIEAMQEELHQFDQLDV
ncbi:hypothetical protein Tco_0921648 [Tanacetum coccineum]